MFPFCCFWEPCSKQCDCTAWLELIWQLLLKISHAPTCASLLCCRLCGSVPPHCCPLVSLFSYLCLFTFFPCYVFYVLLEPNCFTEAVSILGNKIWQGLFSGSRAKWKGCTLAWASSQTRVAASELPVENSSLFGLCCPLNLAWAFIWENTKLRWAKMVSESTYSVARACTLDFVLFTAILVGREIRWVWDPTQGQAGTAGLEMKERGGGDSVREQWQGYSFDIKELLDYLSWPNLNATLFCSTELLFDSAVNAVSL